MKLMEKLNRKTLLEKVMKTRPPATSLWQRRESILLFTGTGATVLLASHMSVEDILFTIRDLADVQQVLVDQLREQCGCCDKEGEKDKPLQRVEEEALQREPQDIVEYLREQGVCLRQLARKLELDYAIDVYPHYGSDVEATLHSGYDIRHGLIGPGVYASHNYERSHMDGVKNTFKLLKGYITTAV